jgi:magnesium-transporting ATPase (P-type)
MNETNLNIGLNSKEIDNLKKKHGSNSLNFAKPNYFNILLTYLIKPISIFIIFTLFAAYSIEEYALFNILFIYFIFETIITLFFEFKAARSLYKQIDKLNFNSRVLRDNAIKLIESSELLPDDVILLQKGEIVPADVIVIDTLEIEISNSNIDGSSSTEFKNINDYIFTGTKIISGSAKCLVKKIGNKTSINSQKIINFDYSKAKFFKDGLRKILRLFLFINIVMIISFFILNYNKFEKNNLNELLILAFSLFLSALPESIFLILTIMLNNTSNKLNKKGLLINNYSTIEACSMVNIACFDKTGTLTNNKPEIINTLHVNSRSRAYLSKVIDNYDLSLLEEVILNYNSENNFVKDNISIGSYINYIPYDHKLKLSGHKFEYGSLWFGGTKEIMNKLFLDELTKLDRMSEIEIEEKKGYRTLAFGFEDSRDYSREFLGVFVFQDDLNESAKNTIKELKELNLDIKLITGDSLPVTNTIAKELDIISTNDFSIIASDLNFDNQEILYKQVLHFNVFAKANAEQKLKIIQSLKTKNQVIYVGDGNNDELAIKEANIGISTLSSTQIARFNSDIILSTNNLKNISELIKESRKCFLNFENSLTFYLMASTTLVLTSFITIVVNSTVSLPSVLLILMNIIIDLLSFVFVFDNPIKTYLTTTKKFSVFKTISLTFISSIILLVLNLLIVRNSLQNSFKDLQTMLFLFTSLAFMIFTLTIYQFNLMHRIFNNKLLIPSILLISSLLILFSFNWITNFNLPLINIRNFNFELVLLIIFTIFTYLLVQFKKEY